MTCLPCLPPLTHVGCYHPPCSSAGAQDLSYLLADRYAFVMQQWLSAAKPLTRILQGQKTSLKEYCNITQPPDRDTTDLYLTYKNNADFEKVAKQLAPMLFSVSGGVSVSLLGC